MTLTPSHPFLSSAAARLGPWTSLLFWRRVAFTLNWVAAATLAMLPILTAAAATSDATNDPIARIRDEGLNRSQVMQTLGYLTDVIGPRLTGSPNLKRANDWTREQFACWGLSNAHLEAWGPFGRG